jgi:hypothetical protein
VVERCLLAPAATEKHLLLGGTTQPQQLENIYRPVFHRSVSLSLGRRTVTLATAWFDELFRAASFPPPLSLSVCYDEQTEMLLLWYKSEHKNVTATIKAQYQLAS